MLQFSPIRTAIILFVAVLGIVFAIPNFFPKETTATWPGWLPHNGMTLGLDLQGGSYLLLQVNQQSVVTERLKTLRRDARQLLAGENGIGNIITTTDKGLTIELTDPTQKAAAQAALQKLQTGNGILGVGGTQELEFGETPDGKLTVTLSDAGIKDRMSSLIAQSIEVIRKRIDEVGTTEPIIQRQGTDRVLVQVPGFNDSQHLKELISKTARLEFHLVNPTMTAEQAKVQGIPPGYEIVPSAEGAAGPPEELINENVELGGEDLTNAQPGFDQQTGRSVVSFSFNTHGAIVFGEITSKNVGKRFAIVLDNQVITAPTIQQPITGGSGQITGNFTPQSANDLAVLLRAGALPATLDVAEERSVGPSLGADSIHAGVTAGVVAAILVVTFMVVAYGLFGFFADISLVLNIVLIVGSLSLLGSTLTLPGIAGIVLTIGMSVDANVLIYERIREELKAGKSILAAIDAGFRRAWGTIIDSHLTQLIAAVVLYFLGSGPVQGFAVTLALGILTSLFTSYTVTLYFVGAWYRWRRPKTIKIQVFRFIPDGTKVPFMKISHYAIVFSVIISLLAIGSAFTKGFNLGIDFIGGSAIELQKSGDGDADPGKIREDLAGLGLGDIQVQQFGTPKDVLVRVQTQPGGDAAQQAAVNKVTAALESDQYSIRRVETVGPQVSGELTTKGVIAVLVALVAILIYVWFRFEWQFALAAITTTTHDVIMTIGLFSVAGLEFNTSSIAAVLTLVGLSLNETVVISDRIRENLRKYKKMSLPELIDLSINQTIVRTSLTQFTILLALFPLVFFGGESIRGFTIAMTFGSIFGMYSSVFIGGPILIYFGLKARGDTPADSKAAKIPKRADGAAV
ncbi:MAG: protein translocase subunit SecDF [Devosia sp. 67-54]|uniref:protein translocase subunit SecD n=1 Tax=unclassified Devosia TaxID=196773 RepID=UPI00095B4215|nr:MULTISPECIES: protein translocase subunit SecD [unclassified Devosia]MBN9304166.1 protein translocase subunit SecD [Devosia sp.]OJX17991.1 MAG: protein translocase subunit SecDF [Devosia sp. 67-54]